MYDEAAQRRIVANDGYKQCCSDRVNDSMQYTCFNRVLKHVRG